MHGKRDTRNPGPVRKYRDNGGVWVRVTVLALILGAIAIAGGYALFADRTPSLSASDINTQLAAIKRPAVSPLGEAPQQSAAPPADGDHIAQTAPPDIGHLAPKAPPPIERQPAPPAERQPAPPAERQPAPPAEGLPTPTPPSVTFDILTEPPKG
jgi:hypothetical protein